MSGYLTVSEAAERLAASEQTVQAAVERGDLPALRHGDEVSIPAAAVESSRITQDGHALLVVRATDDSERPRTHAERVRAFRRRAGSYPRAYLDRWRAGAVDASREHAQLAVEAEQLLDDTPTTSEAAPS